MSKRNRRTQFDNDLDPDDPMSKVIREKAGPVYYTPPEKPPKGTVDPVDKLVTRFTRSLWRRAETIRPSTQPLTYEEQRYRMRKRELPSPPLAMKRAELGALNIGIGAVESFTFPARPSAWIRTAEGLVGLATSRERRREAVEFAQARPEAVGLQLLGGVAGGYAAGRVIGRLRGPSTYALKQKTAQFKEVKTGIGKGGYSLKAIDQKTDWSASLIEKGGTAIVQLKERPGYVTYYEPTPIYGLSRIGFIGLAGTRGRTTTELKSDPVVKQTAKQIQRMGFDPVQRMRERGMFATDFMEKTEEKTKQKIITPPFPTHPLYDLTFMRMPTKHIQRQRRRQRFITIPDLKLEQAQEQMQALTVAQIQRFSLRKPYLTPSTPRLKKKRRKAKKEKGFGLLEVRVDPLKMGGVKKRGSSLRDVLRV